MSGSSVVFKALIFLCVIFGPVILPGLAAAQETSAVKTFDVQAFGAKGDGRTDDQLAIGRALKAAQDWTNATPSARAIVYFPSGTYSLAHILGLYAINLTDARNISIEGQDCRTGWNYCVKLIAAPAGMNTRASLATSNSFFKIIHSHNIAIRNFYLDTERPYFAQGIVTAVDSAQRTVDIRVDAGYPDLNDPVIGTLMKSIVVFTEPQRRNWSHSDAACSDPARVIPGARDCHNYHILGHQQIGPNVWRVTLDQMPPPEFANKTFLIWRYLGWQAGLWIARSGGVTVENIFYTGGGGSGAHVEASDGPVTIRNFRIDVPPNSNRVFAATSGFNGSRNRAPVTLDHVTVAHTDDDALHFLSGLYYPALDQSDGGRKVRVALCYETDFQPGDRVAAWNWATKSEIAEATVVSSTIVTDSDPGRFRRTCDVELDRPLPPLQNMRTYDNTKIGRETDLNDRLLDLSFNGFLTVENSSLSTMRARCGIFQVSALIINNTCKDVVLAGFLIGPEFSWGEGYAVNNVKIIGNRFDNVSGTAIYLANIGDSNRSPTYNQLTGPFVPHTNVRQDNRNIVIQGNTFSNLGTYGRGIMGMRGVAISVENASNVKISGNRIDEPTIRGREAPTGIVVAPATTSNVTMQ